jgi:23S rRNA (uracil1939-C5)-methyltransferase
MARPRIPPFETEITSLAAKGLGQGLAPDGSPAHVRGAVPGARVAVMPAGKRKGVWTGRKVATIRPAPDGQTPRCAVFDLCGGCMLQEASLASQREHKQARALADVALELGSLEGVVVHPVVGAPDAYAYRNRVELSFGRRRWLSEAQQGEGLPHDGRFLGMHAPGRFDRVVDAARCELISEPLNRVLAAVRSVALDPLAPLPWDVHEHQGFWRHVRLREGFHTGERMLVLFTTSPADGDEAWVERVAAAVDGLVVGVVWCVEDGVADVARGDVRRVWGRGTFDERLSGRTFRLSHDSFFQTNTPGAEVLVQAIGLALGSGGRLLDLYSGAGTFGITLADRFDEVFGLEEVSAAVDDARANAAANGVRAEYVCAKVEDALERLGSGAHVVVDPPRAGLHPKVVRRLADLDAASLVYVACRPASLGRDAVALAAGGWRIEALWTVDMFPQTGHTEMVARFVRVGSPTVHTESAEA